MKRHQTDTASLIFGLLFTTITVVWLFSGTVDFTPQSLGTIFASVFILAGLIGLVRALRRPGAAEPPSDGESQ